MEGGGGTVPRERPGVEPSDASSGDASRVGGPEGKEVVHAARNEGPGSASGPRGGSGARRVRPDPRLDLGGRDRAPDGGRWRHQVDPVGGDGGAGLGRLTDQEGTGMYTCSGDYAS